MNDIISKLYYINLLLSMYPNMISAHVQLSMLKHTAIIIVKIHRNPMKNINAKFYTSLSVIKNLYSFT